MSGISLPADFHLADRMNNSNMPLQAVIAAAGLEPSVGFHQKLNEATLPAPRRATEGSAVGVGFHQQLNRAAVSTFRTHEATLSTPCTRTAGKTASRGRKVASASRMTPYPLRSATQGSLGRPTTQNHTKKPLDQLGMLAANANGNPLEYPYHTNRFPAILKTSSTRGAKAQARNDNTSALNPAGTEASSAGYADTKRCHLHRPVPLAGRPSVLGSVYHLASSSPVGTSEMSPGGNLQTPRIGDSYSSAPIQNIHISDAVPVASAHSTHLYPAVAQPQDAYTSSVTSPADSPYNTSNSAFEQPLASSKTFQADHPSLPVSGATGYSLDDQTTADVQHSAHPAGNMDVLYDAPTLAIENTYEAGVTGSQGAATNSTIPTREPELASAVAMDDNTDWQDIMHSEARFASDDPIPWNFFSPATQEPFFDMHFDFNI